MRTPRIRSYLSGERFTWLGRPQNSRRILIGASLLSLIALVTGLALGIVSNAQHSTVGTPRIPSWASKPDAPGSNSGEGDGTEMLTAAEEDYQNRAYPATDIPFQATLNAQAAFEAIESRGQGNDSTGSWHLIGPSVAQDPAVLTFTGAPYVTSGRISALAIAPTCTASTSGADQPCRVWVGAAGGGVWRTDDGLSTTPHWKFSSGGFGTNAIGTLTVDPTDPSGNTIYAGTGEPNASGDSEAGVGIYKSTNGGSTWSLLPGSQAATYARSVSSIVIDPSNPNTIYVGTTRGVRGVGSSGGATTNPPPGVAAPFGLYKSTDGGATFSQVWDGNGTIRGVNHVALDPSNPSIVYAAAFQQGIWRSVDGGATFTQIFAPTSPSQNTDRSEFAVTALASGKTRMYVGDGAVGPGALGSGKSYSQVFRTDDTSTVTPVSGWTSLTSSDRTDPRYATYNYCTGQCWYDNGIFTPTGYPDTLLVLGSYSYGELGGRSNGRAVVLSKDAGATFTDMTNDATSSTAPNGLHPDQHALVFSPSNPDVWFEGSDGGIVRSSGSYADITSQCDARPLSPPSQVACHNLLKAVPTTLFNLNSGLSTLQFQSLSVNPNNPANDVMGGTQDNGTWQFTGSKTVWNQAIYGDGGQSGYNAANPAIRFNTFFTQATDTNFQNGDPTKWVVTSGPLFNSGERSLFYMPIIADPNKANGGYMFAGLQGVWRTTDNGGDQTFLEANCPEFTTSAADPACGDWQRLGTTTLTTSTLGTRGGGNVAAVARAQGDRSTLWAATTTGRVFIAQNANAAANAVTFTRLDTLAANAPSRFVSGIYVDPTNANHAWISYSGYNFNTPGQAGHVFEVTFDPGTTTATWTNLDNGTGPMGDLPVTGLVRDDVLGDLYASTDFGVMTLEHDSSTWKLAGINMPNVEVSGLTIAPGSRILYAATHGRGAWRLSLPGDNSTNDNNG